MHAYMYTCIHITFFNRAGLIVQIFCRRPESEFQALRARRDWLWFGVRPTWTPKPCRSVGLYRSWASLLPTSCFCGLRSGLMGNTTSRLKHNNAHSWPRCHGSRCGGFSWRSCPTCR